MQLKKTSATLDELLEQEAQFKQEIRSLQRQQKTIRVTIRSIEKLAAAMPQEKKRSRVKKSVAAATA